MHRLIAIVTCAAHTLNHGARCGVLRTFGCMNAVGFRHGIAARDQGAVLGSALLGAPFDSSQRPAVGVVSNGSGAPAGRTFPHTWGRSLGLPKTAQGRQSNRGWRTMAAAKGRRQALGRRGSGGRHANSCSAARGRRRRSLGALLRLVGQLRGAGAGGRQSDSVGWGWEGLEEAGQHQRDQQSAGRGRQESVAAGECGGRHRPPALMSARCGAGDGVALPLNAESPVDCTPGCCHNQRLLPGRRGHAEDMRRRAAARQSRFAAAASHCLPKRRSCHQGPKPHEPTWLSQQA